MKSVERSVLWVGLDEFYERYLEPAGFEVDVEAPDAMTKVFEEWNEAVAQEPVLSSLGVLANREQMWVGIEEELWRERGLYPSTPYRTSEAVWGSDPSG